MFRTYAKASAQVGAGGGVAQAKTTSGAGAWHPTVLYLIGLLVVEFVAVGLLTRYLVKE